MADQALSGNSAIGATPQSVDNQWSAIENDSEFQSLVHKKRNFIIPATIFFIVYYFSLPVLVGYFPDIMNIDVVGNINIAYLFALSQFIMAWVLMALYVRRAGLFDEMARQITQRVRGGKK